MFELEFNEISKQPDCTYKVEHFKVDGTFGFNKRIAIHYLNLKYKGVTINVKYELGNHNLAEINFSMKLEKAFPKIKIENKNQFSKLFSFNKKIWKIKCREKQVILDLAELLNTSGLTKIAEREAFEPEIEGESKNSNFDLYTRFYLGFNNKEKSIRPIIEFHKGLIDYIIQVADNLI